MTKTLKPYPDFRGDDEAEQKFMDTHGLANYDFSPNAIPLREWFWRYEQYAKDQSLMRHYIERGMKDDS